jgi:hypothetical protein
MTWAANARYERKIILNGVDVWMIKADLSEQVKLPVIRRFIISLQKEGEKFSRISSIVRAIREGNESQ